MARLKLTLAYVGTRFHGWQLQARGQATVQGVVEAALERIVGHPVRVHGAGRTDAGVHALGQVAHVDVAERLADLPWRSALNGLLPEDVSVVEAVVVQPEFHARFDATAKTYGYSLWLERDYVLPQRRPFVWRTGPLDHAAMEAAAAQLLGCHDFAAFQNAGTELASSQRTITGLHRHPGLLPQETIWRVTADGFLKQMVRNIMGCLVQVGRGKLSPEAVRWVLTSRDRTLAPATAPAWGLCLEHVDYGAGSGRQHPLDSLCSAPDGVLSDLAPGVRPDGGDSA